MDWTTNIEFLIELYYILIIFAGLIPFLNIHHATRYIHEIYVLATRSCHEIYMHDIYIMGSFERNRELRLLARRFAGTLQKISLFFKKKSANKYLFDPPPKKIVLFLFCNFTGIFYS